MGRAGSFAKINKRKRFAVTSDVGISLMLCGMYQDTQEGAIP